MSCSFPCSCEFTWKRMRSKPEQRRRFSSAHALPLHPPHLSPCEWKELRDTAQPMYGFVYYIFGSVCVRGCFGYLFRGEQVIRDAWLQRRQCGGFLWGPVSNPGVSERPAEGDRRHIPVRALHIADGPASGHWRRGVDTQNFSMWVEMEESYEGVKTSTHTCLLTCQYSMCSLIGWTLQTDLVLAAPVVLMRWG